MNYLGIDYEIKNVPVLDENFIPFGVWMREFQKGATEPVKIAIERENGLITVRETFIRDHRYAEANMRYIERLVKFMLWSVGGYKIYICGCDLIAKQLRLGYRKGGFRDFDYGFFHDVYGRYPEVIVCSEDKFPKANESAKAIGGHLDGCRIGFDAGGSDRKVSAVIDG